MIQLTIYLQKKRIKMNHLKKFLANDIKGVEARKEPLKKL